jgi:hypothetical protein
MAALATYDPDIHCPPAPCRVSWAQTAHSQLKNCPDVTRPAVNMDVSCPSDGSALLRVARLAVGRRTS